MSFNFQTMASAAGSAILADVYILISSLYFLSTLRRYAFKFICMTAPSTGQEGYLECSNPSQSKKKLSICIAEYYLPFKDRWFTHLCALGSINM